MDTNKTRDISREQFEAWFESSGMEKFKETAWAAWQASREAVVVELPGRDKDPCAYSLGFNACLKKSQEAIEAQGLKVLGNHSSLNN